MTNNGPTRGQSRWLLSGLAGAGLIAVLAFAVVPARADTGTVTVTATSTTPLSCADSLSKNRSGS
jgi:hypothetical protein